MHRTCVTSWGEFPVKPALLAPTNDFNVTSVQTLPTRNVLMSMEFGLSGSSNVSMLTGQLLVATFAGWLIYSLITRNAPLCANPSAGVFATQILGSVLGAIAFAWLFAPLSSIAIDDFALQFKIRASGMLLCSVPVIVLWTGLRLIWRTRR